MYSCPACKVLLERTHLDFGVVWVCPRCGGRAVTVSLLRRKVQRQFINSIWQKVRSDSESKPRPDRLCPACRRPLRQLTDYGISGPLELDACRSCQFIWFDPGEREQLPTDQDTLPAAPPLPDKALEIQTLEEIEKIRRQYQQPAIDSGPLTDWWQVISSIFSLPDTGRKTTSKLPRQQTRARNWSGNRRERGRRHHQEKGSTWGYHKE